MRKQSLQKVRLAWLWPFAAMAALLSCGQQSEVERDRVALVHESERVTGQVEAEVDLAGTEVRAVAPPRVNTTVIGTDGRPIGSLAIEPLEQSGVRLDLHVEGLSPGAHALHFHERGRCDPPDFASAGGHFDPAGASHGFPDADTRADDQDHHAGDMLNQTVDDQGMMDQIIINRAVSIDTGPNPLVYADGSALVIHAQPDDFETQPAGGAGERVACAVIDRVTSRGD